jgi:hypothetical protein
MKNLRDLEKNFSGAIKGLALKSEKMFDCNTSELWD